ncbi:MAG TPA: ABC transporter substrate-binding protein [Candidatus Limnocylindria bacterium]|nr:ABC transporter substrate-binding protein [Candidatus Limnocylindria bacterium]
MTVKRVVCAMLGAVAVVIAACGGSAPATSGSDTPAQESASAAAKPLSMSTVILTANFNSTLELYYIADAEGFFKQQGLTDMRQEGFGTQGADQIALLLGGHAQFINIGTSLLMNAAASGSPIVSVMNVAHSGSVAVVLNPKIAADKHIPTANKSAADAIAQVKALKGTKLKIGTPSATGDNFSDAATVFKANGLTLGPDGDVDLQALGGTSNMLAGYKAGKIDGYVLTAPQTFVADAVTIPLYLVPPLAGTAFVQLATTKDMIQNHADVVQAVVNSYLRAAQFATKNPAKSLADVKPLYEAAGVKDEATQKQVFDQTASELGTPANTRAMFDEALALAGYTAKSPLKLDFTAFVDNRFVNAGIKSLGLPYAPGPEK